MTNKEYADLLLPGIKKTVEDYEKIYKERNLNENAIVTRYAPSPTGFVHMGALFASFIERTMAKQSNGVFYLRIEDTDQKRSIENGIEAIIRDLKNFNVSFDEGMISENLSIGEYGPYIQSERKDIYWAFAKYLIETDLAYPCFCSNEDLEETRKKQEEIKARIGYYGSYAKCRNLSKEEVIEKIKNGEKYVIRLKSPGDFNKKFIFEDLIKGKIELPENDLDIVIIKGDELPTYHFAHLVDDHLMRTTHVIRGDEWLSSIPIHVQLFKMFDFKLPKYAHIAPLLKEEDGNRRKLSKRKDPEAAVSFYHEQGIPVYAVILYLATVANSNFEAWFENNKDKSYSEFRFDFKKMSTSGSLYDLDKLINISKNYISRLSKEEVYDMSINWSKEYDQELYNLLVKYDTYSKNLFNIERVQKKPRKDIGAWNEVKDNIWYMYDELFDKSDKDYEYQLVNDKEEIKNICNKYMEKYYNESDDKETWFNKMKELANDFGYAKEVKDYKENPNNYKGHVGDIATVLRVSLTKLANTPDLYEIMNLLGSERIKKRFEKI